MSKQIMPNELAEIVSGLLVKPRLLGELETPEKHQAFMLDIGRVVADHCGGKANWVNGGDDGDQYMLDEHSSPTLSISPNDSLPSLLHNVWAAYDPDGWEEAYLDIDSIPAGEMMTAMQLEALRKQLQAILLQDF